MQLLCSRGGGMLRCCWLLLLSCCCWSSPAWVEAAAQHARGSSGHCGFSGYSVITDRHLKIHVAEINGTFSFEQRYGLHTPEQMHKLAFADCSVEAPFGHPRTPELWSTNQFCTEIWFWKQLTQSPLRVGSWQDADVIYVPIYMLDLNRFDFYKNERGPEWHWLATIKEFYRQARNGTLLPALGKKPHFIVLPRGEVHYRLPLGSIMDESTHGPIVRDFTFLTIETAGRWARQAKDGRLPADMNSVAVPHPGSVHWRRQSLLRHHKQQQSALPKSLLAVGSWNSRFPLRVALRDQCRARSKECVVLDFDESKYLDGLVPLFRLEQSSWYCMQPTGDTYSRRQFFSCLAAGSVPVVFEPDMRLLVPFGDILNADMLMVDLSEHRQALLNSTSSGANVVDLLQAPEVAAMLQRRLQYVLRFRHMFQYMLDPIHELITLDEAGSVHCFDDAFTASMKALVRNLCGRGKMPKHRCSKVAAAAAGGLAAAA